MRKRQPTPRSGEKPPDAIFLWLGKCGLIAGLGDMQGNGGLRTLWAAATSLYDVRLIADSVTYHVRRKDKEITDPSAMKNVLQSTKCVTLALCRDNEPYLVTLTHGYDENRNCVYFHCAKEGKKIDYMKAHSRVWGQAFIDHGYVDGECDHQYTSVHFSGKVAFLENLEEKMQAMECMMRHLERKSEEMIAKLKPEKLQNTLIVRVDIDYMSGKTSNKPAK